MASVVISVLLVSLVIISLVIILVLLLLVNISFPGVGRKLDGQVVGFQGSGLLNPTLSPSPYPYSPVTAPLCFSWWVSVLVLSGVCRDRPI